MKDRPSPFPCSPSRQTPSPSCTMPPPSSPLTLKQRLANLASQPSSPSPSFSDSVLNMRSSTSLSSSSLSRPHRSQSFQSLSSSFTSNASSTLAKTRAFFHNGGRTSPVHVTLTPAEQHEQLNAVEAVLPRMIFQAGVDFEYVS